MFLTLSAPVTLQWELTPWCNHRCVHCYNFWRVAFIEKLTVSPETLKTYEAATEEIIRNKVFQVTITGGEPLAVFKWAYPFLEKLAEAGLQISLNSNLTLLTKEKTQLLRRLGVRSILTSLMAGDSELNDSLANTPGAHARTTRGIQIALEAGFWVGVNMVVTKKNIHAIYPTAQYVASLGITSFSATKASTPLNSPDFKEYALSLEEFRLMLDELVRVNEELGLEVDSLEFYPTCAFQSPKVRTRFGSRMCNAGRTSCTIGFDGQIRPCSHASWTYGHITNGLQNAWSTLQPWRTNELIPEKCQRCPLRLVCGGGCRTEAYAATGNMAGLDPYCDFSRPPVPKLPEETASALDGDSKFAFHPSLKTRREEFGGILYLTPRRWLPVNHQVFEFARKNQNGTFSVHELANLLQTPTKEIVPTIELLVSKSIIQERR